MIKLADKEKCTGCTACMSVCPKSCIEMRKDQNGFSFPEIRNISSCIKCGACQAVCPILDNSKPKDYALPLCYAAFSKNTELRMDSSSGGVFSEIAKMVFEKQGVVYGAAYNETFEVCHCCIENIDDLYKIRGAKYSESDLGNVFSEILERIKRKQFVLFAGTPCQVAGLKAFLKKDYVYLICIDFVCHGVPSPVAWKKYVEFRAAKDADGEMPVAINLRSKHTGWSNYQYSNLFQYKNGKEYSSLSSQNLFMNLFVGDYISRESCANCKFKGYQRVCDITLGDFWGIWDIIPKMDDNRGTSVVLIQSDKGNKIWEGIKKHLVYEQVTLEQASQLNQSMLVPSKQKDNREAVLMQIRIGKIEECGKLFVQRRVPLVSKIKGKISRIFCK